MLFFPIRDVFPAVFPRYLVYQRYPAAILWAYGVVGITLDSRRCDQGSIPGRADKYDIHFISEYMIKSP